MRIHTVISSRTKIGSFCTALLFVFASGIVFAQDVPDPDEREAGEEPAEIQLPMKKRARISASDMISKTAEYIKRMQDVLERAVQLQQIARKNKDVIKLNCVNDKLLQVKQLINIAEAANTNLRESIARQNEDGRYHEFGRVTIVHQQVSVIGTEAENCIGEDLTFLGPTEVTVERPDEPDDPTKPLDPEIPVVEPPPVASPFI